MVAHFDNGFYLSRAIQQDKTCFEVTGNAYKQKTHIKDMACY